MFADGAYCWKADSKEVQECIEEIGLNGGKAPSTLGAKDMVQSFAGLEDIL